MLKQILLPLLLITMHVGICTAQDSTQSQPINRHHNLPSLPLTPQFPGGKDSLAAFLAKNVHYPTAAKRHHVTGTIEVDFSVDEQGVLSNIHVLKPLGYGCDKEAIRAVKKMPKWVPGRNGRKPMALDYHVDIIFAPSEKK